MSLIDITPVITSNTTPSPYIVSASSIFSSSYDAWNAFDGITTGEGWATINNTVTGWLKFDFGSSIRISAFTIVGSQYQLSASPKNFILYGSSDNNIWEKITEINNEIIWASSEQRLFRLNNDVTFRYYKIVISSNNGYNYTSIAELKFWQDNAATTTVTTKKSSMSFGLAKSSTLNLRQKVNDSREGLLAFASDVDNYGTLWMINDKGQAQMNKAAMAEGDILFDGWATSGTLSKDYKIYKYLYISVNANSTNNGMSQHVLLKTSYIPQTIGFTIYGVSTYYLYSLFVFRANNTFGLGDTQRAAGWTAPLNVTKIIGIY